MTRNSTKKPFKIKHVTVGWPKGHERTCKKCNSTITFQYVSAIRLVFTLFGILAVRFNYYACENDNCPFHVPFTVPNDIVLPNKKFGRDVWEHVIRHVHELHQNFTTIAKGMEMDFKIKVSAATIARMWRTYLVLSSAKADAKTARVVKAKGNIVLATDGQRPQEGRPSLWYFIDTACNMVLHAVLLTCADADTLGNIFKSIEQKYGVPIIAVLSDHQKSIVKAVKDYLPNAVHQACHFHFLNNLHDPLEAVDSHLQSTLKQGVNSLYINRASTKTAPLFSNGRREPVRTVFASIMDDLKELIGNKRVKFDMWAGFTSFKNIETYIPRLMELLAMMLAGSRESTILAKTIDALVTLLAKARPYFEKMQILIPRFDQMRMILGTTANTSSNTMRTAAMEWAQELRWWLHERGVDVVDCDLRVELLTYEATVDEIVSLWIALFNSHEPGLFHFLDVKGLPRSNAGMEQEFSVENCTFRQQMGKCMVGSSVRVSGDVTLRVQKAYSQCEIQSVLHTYTREAERAGEKLFKNRRAQERRWWKRVRKVLGGITRIQDWLYRRKVGGGT
jgi:hypothetical protein